MSNEVVNIFEDIARNYGTLNQDASQQPSKQNLKVISLTLDMLATLYLPYQEF